jgi:uncharacterized protein YdeI (YjbR/CyaY-like superfamily)
MSLVLLIHDQSEETMALKRTRYSMPDFIRDALNERGLMDAYHARPPYQQNDYIGWITRAKQAATKQKRLDQMLDELESGGVYMNMKWNQ